MNKPPSGGLVRALGPVTAIAVVVGTTIGSGVFKKPQIIAEKVDQFGLIALLWILGGVLVVLGALAYAEVSILFPKAGGNFVFLRESYGRLAAFLWASVEILIIRTASIAALATVFAESLNTIIKDPAFTEKLGMSQPIGLTPWGERWLTVGVILVLGFVNVRGVRWGGGLQLLITLVKIGSLLAILALPFVLSAYVPSAPRPEPEYLTPVWPSDWSGVNFGKLGSAFLGVLWAYHGWMMLSPVAEEVTHPQRNLPLALLTGVGIIVFLYLGANLAYALVIPHDEMAALKDTTVAAEFGRRMLGPLGGAAASAAVMISVFGALNGNLLAGPRVLYALGGDGLAPAVLNRVHPRFHTPALAIIVETVWSALLVLVVALLTDRGDVFPPNKGGFDVLTDFAMFGAVLFETLAVVAIFVLRWRMPDAPRSFRCPGYPIVPALYTLLPAYIIVNTLIQKDARVEAISALVFTGLSAMVYAIFLDRPAAPASGRIVNRRVVWAAAAAVLAAIIGGGVVMYRTGAAKPEEDAKAQLMDADRAFAKATAEKGLDGWVSFMAKDAARVMPLGGKAAVGEEAIRKLDAPMFADPKTKLEWEPMDAGLFSGGDYGFTTGRARVVTVGEQKADSPWPIKYVTWWRKGDDGRWKVILDTGASERSPR
jgi:amino acid transporter